jgi:RNA polymerase sigma factor (sigma-70 family)
MNKASKEEFAAWLESRQVMLIAAARGICIDAQIAEDVLQEALTDICKRWDKIKNHENLEAYTTRVMISKHSDMRKKWNRRKNESEVELDAALSLLYVGEDTDSVLASMMIQQALKTLTPMQRAVMLLHYEYGYTLKDIAAVLKVPSGTVASHLARGKAAVAEKAEILPAIMQQERDAISYKEMKAIRNESEGEA